MNKVQVGSAPSPNLKTVRSKIGSLDNASYKPGGGKVKIENRKVDFSKTQPKIAAKNDAYVPGGGDKKVSSVRIGNRVREERATMPYDGFKQITFLVTSREIRGGTKDKSTEGVRSTLSFSCRLIASNFSSTLTAFRGFCHLSSATEYRFTFLIA